MQLSRIHLFIFTLIIPASLFSQHLTHINISESNLRTESFSLSDSSILSLPSAVSLFSFELDNKTFRSEDVSSHFTSGKYIQNFEEVKTTFFTSEQPGSGMKSDLIFENTGSDTIRLSNVVPFGTEEGFVYITGKGPSDLARAWLFRPGYSPVRVILPDNAWEMGYSSFEAGNGLSVCAIARRGEIDGGQKQRYTTILPPNAKVTYSIYADIFRGEWQNGLRTMFRDRYLYDLEKFDNSIYEREDLAWIKKSYLIILQMAWDKDYFDRSSGKYTYPDLIRSGLENFGNIDVFGIWPTWPRLGLDKRNQWDLYRDLPGGTGQLRNFARMSRLSNTRLFISYNPWDNSTRKEDHLSGMAKLIQETEADGVVLDTRGSSSYELQATADSVRKGVVMFSEGMAVIKDMPGIISGRVHNAIFLSPELNLNKLIKPDFAIFRVCDVGEDQIHRELTISFFNGYGTELNMFRPGGRDDSFKNDMEFLARTTFVLRQNNDAFLDHNWTPLIESTIDKVYINRWRTGEKTIYTILNMKPEGISGKLFKVENSKGKHYVSLWNHEKLLPEIYNGDSYISAQAAGWPASYSGTRKEGSLDCIAEFPEIIKSSIAGDSICISSTNDAILKIWKGNPSYKSTFKEFTIENDTVIRLKDLFGFYEGKMVLQLLKDGTLIDENIVEIKGGNPWLVSSTKPTKRLSVAPPQMVLVPGADFSFDVTANDDFIPYPAVNNLKFAIDSFLIDKYPVSNADYYAFITASGYMPADTAGFLNHWESGIYKQGQDKYPVVNVSYEDALAYTKWAEKRLPTQAEWQLAAQGSDKRIWPWGNEFHATFCNNAFNRPTPVDAFPKGQSPFGVMDLVGNVWQMTNDMYFNGTNYFVVIRGGSFYKPDSSWWYVQGGPQQLDKTQIMLMVSPGFDRSETVGFRCVKDFKNQ